MESLELVEYGKELAYSNPDTGFSFIARRSIRTLHRQFKYHNLRPSEHWTARYKRFPIKEITSRMTYEEGDYILTECNQDMNVEEMSISWLTKQLRSDDIDWQV